MIFPVNSPICRPALDDPAAVEMKHLLDIRPRGGTYHQFGLARPSTGERGSTL
ncbi:MAG: hypothetical protein PHW55_11140 [Methanothrix sp.]|nr:hypothetical protein [Methanothrix harundinacea]MDD5769124.1 hypothetical protein [Methanothrix sp.]MDI9398419.1 hypothetical protein [Euryarchaeota archaeon]